MLTVLLVYLLAAVMGTLFIISCIMVSQSAINSFYGYTNIENRSALHTSLALVSMWPSVS